MSFLRFLGNQTEKEEIDLCESDGETIIQGQESFFVFSLKCKDIEIKE